MKYTLRNFQNNFQVAASVGWIMVILSLVFLLIKGEPGVLIIGAIGGLVIYWQNRGKRIIVDTNEQFIKSGFSKEQIKDPQRIYINKVRISQNVNSHVSSANVKFYFYKAFLQDGEEKHLISCNRKEERDMERLKAIAKDLKIDLELNY